jgi:hypothetical protein
MRIRREPNARCSECDDSGIMIERIDAAHFEWLSAIARGATLAEALERAVDTDPAFHLQTALQKFIGDGSIDRVVHAVAQVDGMETSVTGLKAPRD